MDTNSASEKWYEICFHLSDNINPATTEKDFENQVVRAIEVLGWREFKREIARQPTIQIGSQLSIRPDLIIFNQEPKPLIVIEVKKSAQNIARDDTIGQLRSYMRQTKSDFGFLISNELRIYYDGSLNPQSDSLLLEKIPFDKSSPAGRLFVENFSRDSFMRNDYLNYLQGCINKFSQKRETNKLIDILLSEATKEKIHQFLEVTYADFGSEIYSAALKEVSIEINRLQNHYKQPSELFKKRPKTLQQNRSLGRKGYDQLTDYLIPAIRLIKTGLNHTDAFHQIAKKLGVTYQTVNAQCTVRLGHISTEQFVELIKSNKIKSFLKQIFPDKTSLIERDLTF